VQVNPNARFWGLARTQATAAGSSSNTNTVDVPNASGGDLYVQRLRFKAWQTAAVVAIAGTPLNSQGHPTAASGTMAPSTLITINVKVGANQWFSQDVSIFALHGEEGKPYEFELTLPKVGNRQSLSWSVGNATLVAATVEMLADCIAVPAGEPPFVN
jgi:hypothetical protein